MHNYDEQFLRSRRINPMASVPVMHQAVRIALYHEYAARSFHARVVEAFGQRPPFPALLQADAAHIEMLNALCTRFGIPRPLDPFPMETTIEPSWLANCERAAAGKVAGLRLYEELLRFVGQPEVRRAFINLQQATINTSLPMIRQAITSAVSQEQYHAAHGIPPQQAYVHHGPFSDFLERFFAQFGPLGVFSPLVRHIHPALLAGIAAGSAGAVFLKKKTGRNSKPRQTQTQKDI